ncbi:TSUP family transporter [Bordetella sp. 2513F-2]
MTLFEHVLFLGSVAVATVAQTLTGFAFGLVLLGLTGIFTSVPLIDMANVVNMLTLINAMVALQRGRSAIAWRLMLPAFGSSLAGVVAGVLVLGRLDGHMVLVGQALLGITILVCALLLVVRVQPLPRVSPRSSFLFFGGVAGMMGGLFSSSGPPMVYHLYRQPLPLATVRNSLVALFAVNALLRLGLVGAHGGLHASSLWLSLEAMPVVVAATWLTRRYAPVDSLQWIKRAVFVLLWAAGLGLLGPALHHLF